MLIKYLVVLCCHITSALILFHAATYKRESYKKQKQKEYTDQLCLNSLCALAPSNYILYENKDTDDYLILLT